MVSAILSDWSARRAPSRRSSFHQRFQRPADLPAAICCGGTSARRYPLMPIGTWPKTKAVLRRRHTEACSLCHEIGEGIGHHFSHHPTTVRLHGDLADAKLKTDLFVQHAADDQPHHLAFAPAEQGVVVPEPPYLRGTIKDDPATLQSLTNGAQQRVATEWLCQELESARLHGPDRCWNIAVARDEDDRHVRSIDGDLLLQVEATEAGKREIEHQTAGDEGAWAGQEFRCRPECLRLPTGIADQPFEGLADGNVVVDDEHDWGSL